MGQRRVRTSGVRFVVLALSSSAVLSLAAQAATAPVGATPGSFSVDPNGGANYTIPIQIPPGSAGLAPGIALTYTKQVDDPLVGVGWSISGLSIIRRCGSTIALDSAVKRDAKLDITRFRYIGRAVTNIDTGVALPRSGIKSIADTRLNRARVLREDLFLRHLGLWAG